MQHSNGKTAAARLLPAFLAAVALAGCAGSPAVVRPGDKAGVVFTCRLPNGDVAVSTGADAGKRDGSRLSAIYQERSKSDPVEILAGNRETRDAGALISFENEVLRQLSPAIIDMKNGEERIVVLQAEPITGLPLKETRLELPRNRTRAKSERFSRSRIRELAKKEPVAGMILTYDALMTSTITGVNGDDISVSNTPKQGDDLRLNFGTAKIADSGDQYKIVIDNTVGNLVRTGPYVGKVIDVNEKNIVMDFSNPFGGEALNCDIGIRSVVPGNASPAAASAEHGMSAEHGKSAELGKPSLDNPDDARKQLLNQKMAQEIEAQLKAGAKVINIDTDKLAASIEETPASPGSAGEKVAGTGGVDLATVRYTATLEDGSLLFTTRKDVANDPSVRKSPWFTDRAVYGDETLAVGKAGLIPGVGEALAGMKVGEKKTITLPPDKAYGPVDAAKLVKLPLSRKMPRNVTLTPEEYARFFNSGPAVGKEVPLTPFFPARVTAVREKGIDLAFQVKDGATFNDPFGVSTVKVDKDAITVTMKPVIGAEFTVQSGKGIISAVDGSTFTVDTNHPLAGKSLTIDLELTGLTKAADLPHGSIAWQEDHDEGLALAKKEGKPAVLVLYADQCPLCKRLFSETMTDPSIVSLRDRLAWIEADSGKLASIKQRYGQNDYPMIVLFRADGTIAGKLNGFQEAAAFRAALQELL
jgi:FKBP-type peptidyl-prolyl cis-trans isomerase 2